MHEYKRTLRQFVKHGGKDPPAVIRAGPGDQGRMHRLWQLINERKIALVKIIKRGKNEKSHV